MGVAAFGVFKVYAFGRRTNSREKVVELFLSRLEHHHAVVRRELYAELLLQVVYDVGIALLGGLAARSESWQVE